MLAFKALLVGSSLGFVAFAFVFAVPGPSSQPPPFVAAASPPAATPQPARAERDAHVSVRAILCTDDEGCLCTAVGVAGANSRGAGVLDEASERESHEQHLRRIEAQTGPAKPLGPGDRIRLDPF